MATRKRETKGTVHRLPSVYQLKVTLFEIEPPVWRRLLVPASITLGELHYVLNEAMGWTCSHLHSFGVGDRTFGDPQLDPDDELHYEDERKVRLDSLVREGDTFSYEYDFGDDWGHEVLVEKRLAEDPRLVYPVCIGGARACPPEDSGGPMAYEEFLEAIDDPKHPRHDELLGWIGGYFDPEGFDPNRTNEALRALEAERG